MCVPYDRCFGSVVRLKKLLLLISSASRPFSPLISCHIIYLSFYTACLLIQRSNKSHTVSLCLPYLITETLAHLRTGSSLSLQNINFAVKMHQTHTGFTNLLNFISKLISQVVLDNNYIALCSCVE